MKSLCVFCGSSKGNNSNILAAAHELADLIVKEKLALVYGGASVGLMGEVADCVSEGGGEVLWLIKSASSSGSQIQLGLTVPSQHKTCPQLVQPQIVPLLCQKQQDFSSSSSWVISTVSGIGGSWRMGLKMKSSSATTINILMAASISPFHCKGNSPGSRATLYWNFLSNGGNLQVCFGAVGQFVAI